MPAKDEVEHHAGYGVALAILALLLIHATALIMVSIVLYSLKFNCITLQLICGMFPH